MISEIYISRVLAHSIVFESNPHSVQLFACGSSAAPGVQETTDQVMQAYTKNFPGLMQAINGQTTATAQADLAAQQATLPGTAALQTQLYGQYGPELNRIGNEINQQNQLAQSNTDLSVLQGPGQKLIDAAQAAQKGIDPQYYAARDAAMGGLSKLYNSLDDPNKGLSGSEQADVERSLNRSNAATGNLAVPTATNTVSNAMNFGAAGAARKQQKQQAINDALGSTTGILPTFKSGIDAMQVATGRPSQNVGNQMLTNANTQQVGQTASNVGNSMFGSMMNYAGATNVANTQRETLGSTIAGFKPNCCWTFMEYYNGPIPWYVRAIRDAHAERDPYLRVGYKWMSRRLIPLMRISRTMRWLVGQFMVEPLTEHSRWYVGMNARPHNLLNTFWLRTWSIIGRITS